MTEKTGVNTNDLVVEGDYGKGKKLPQYIAAVSVCLGSVAAGTALGWTGNITSDELQKGDLNNIFVDPDTDYGWIGSFMTLGATIICFPIGILCDFVGRKPALLLTVIPITVGWLLIIFADGVGMIFAGRFLTGLAGGAFCVGAPIYTSEIAEKEIRGALGSFFQLLLMVGVLFVYVLGAFMDAKIVSIVCACVPICFGIAMYFQPETPVYLLKKGKDEEAVRALRKLRGDEYNVEAEIRDIKMSIERDASRKVSFVESFKKRAAKRSLVICFGLIFFLQFSGINVILFYVGTIFEDADSSLSSSDATIIVGVMQAGATFVSSLVVDKFGRRILLLFSDLMMAISGILLGIYFTLKERNILEDYEIDDIGFLPILALCMFVIVFSLGFGPIPWVILGEMLPPDIKGYGSSGASTLSWFLAFLVTKFYSDLTKTIQADGTFYMFSAFSLAGTVFVYFIVPETKGKSLDEIQIMLNGERHIAEGSDNKGFS